jgi:hypothetical protein
MNKMGFIFNLKVSHLVNNPLKVVLIDVFNNLRCWIALLQMLVVIDILSLSSIVTIEIARMLRYINSIFS